MTVEFCYLAFITADYYAINHGLLPRFLHHKKYVLFTVTTLLVIAVSAACRSLIAVQMNEHLFHTPVTGFAALYLNSIINITVWVLLLTIGKMIIDRTQINQQLELLEKERVKNELDYLKAQINPHALFNSLNTIYGSIDKNNKVARDTLLQFSELLRYQLYDCSAEKVSLEKEMDYVKNYTAFQRVRKDEKLVTHLNIEAIEPGLSIAPLLLVVLIENAFKFVSNFAERENEIIIRIHTEGTTLYSSFINTKELQQGNLSDNSNGIGITNLKRRLELLYPEKHTLTTIIDDEPIARKILREYIEEIDYLELIGEAENPLKATTILDTHTIDIVFLDINMPKISGINFLKSAKTNASIIMTTAYNEYAVEAYGLDVLDYLLKPIAFDRFVKACNKAKEARALQKTITDNPDKPDDHFFIKCDNQIEKVLYDELIYAEAMMNYVMLHTHSRKMMVYITIRRLEEQLPTNIFIKVHKSFIVNRNKPEP
ncbi:hypothetical protein F5148DRAFT_1294075 [Russula earlei]|uniref:Uncharacterized protein n=1 Tax=Russula earlei TaxID=71964 RepID=A0ACC0TS06_9AGAM|nr:hypothetical protein F5148DRAFT_1294075 [Russula earlei]